MVVKALTSIQRRRSSSVLQYRTTGTLTEQYPPMSLWLREKPENPPLRRPTTELLMPSFFCQLTIWSPSQKSIDHFGLSLKPARMKKTRAFSSVGWVLVVGLKESVKSRLTLAHSSGYLLWAEIGSSPAIRRR